MITLHASLDDVDAEPVLRDGSVQLGGSALGKFETRHLAIAVVGGEGWRGAFVGEDVPEFRPDCTSASAVEAVRSITGFDGILLCFDRTPDRRIRLARTAEGTSPLFVASNGRCLAASWRFEVAVRALEAPRPDVEACRRFLQSSQTRSRNQIIEGVFALWPGEVACLDELNLLVGPMASPGIALPGALSDGARATDAFVEMVAGAMARAMARSALPLVELSGGFDSSCVAVAASSLRPGLSSYGLIQPGAVGRQQRVRRAEIVALLGLRDHAGAFRGPTPIQSLAAAECRLTPYDDLYRLPCMSALDEAPETGHDMVVTGIGGDELTKEDTFALLDGEVPGIPASSATVAAASRADMFMRRGVWPVNPLCSAAVVSFCRALPPELRQNRELNKLVLARAGLSDGFIFPRYSEHFGNVLAADGIETDYDEFFRESVVADHRIADLSGVLREARAATADGLSWRLISRLYNLAKLEAVLRTYVT